MVHRHFCRLEANQKPCKSSLQSLVSRLTAETWEAINRGLLTTAQKENIERGRTVAIDSTVTASDIKMPYDSDLLAGCHQGDVPLSSERTGFNGRPLVSVHFSQTRGKTGCEGLFLCQQERRTKAAL